MAGRMRRWRRCAALACAAFFMGGGAAWADAGGVFKAPPSEAARQMFEWVLQSRDHGGRPFAVVDKHSARIHVFDRNGHLRGDTEVLLGETVGDFTVAGVGRRAQTGNVGADERTTPAGRFDAVPGRNLKGEHVVWADYESAFAIHRLRPGRSQPRRAAGLATATPEDNRLSLGCVVVPVAFYEQVVQPVLGAGRSVVYVLPETRTLQEFLAQLAQH